MSFGKGFQSLESKRACFNYRLPHHSARRNIYHSKHHLAHTIQVNWTHFLAHGSLISDWLNRIT